MTDLGTLELEVKLLKNQFDTQMRQVEEKINQVGRKSPIMPKVDLKELHGLNEALDVKNQHLDATIRHFANSPIRPVYDPNGLNAGINQIRAFRNELGHLRTDIARGSSFSGSIRHNIDVSITGKDNILVQELRLVSRGMANGFRDVVNEVAGLKPGIVGKALGFVSNVATAPFRFAGGVASGLIGNIFTGFTEDIGRTLFGELGRQKTVGFANQSKKFAKIINEEVIGQDKAYATFFAELFRSGDIGQATGRAVPRTEIGKIYERLMKLQDIVTQATPKESIAKINKDPELREIFDRSGRNFRVFLENAQPQGLAQNIINPVMEDFQPLLRFIQDIRAARTAIEAERIYAERKSTFPVLNNFQSVVSVAGGAQFKGGQGGRNVAMGLEMLAPNAYFMPVENPDTDAAGNESLLEKVFKEAVFKAIPGVGGEFLNTAVNGLRQVMTSLDFTGYSKAAAQGIANTMLAQEQGKQAAFTSFSLGGVDSIAYANTQSYLGLNSPSLAMNYPFLNLANRRPPNFKAGVGVEDPLSFPMILGLGFGMGGLYQQSGGKVMGASAHHYKHILKNTEFLQLFFKTIGSEIPDISSQDFGSIIEAGEKLYEIMGAAEQMKSLSETGEFNKESPFHAFMAEGGTDKQVNAEKMLSKFFEWNWAIDGMLKADSPEIRSIGEQLKQYFEAIQKSVVKKLQEIDYPFPTNVRDMVGHQKYQSEAVMLNTRLGDLMQGKNPESSMSDLAKWVDKIEKETIRWFKKPEQQGLFGEEYVNKIVAAYKNFILVAKEFIKTNGQLSDSFKEGIVMSNVVPYGDKANEFLYQNQLNPFELPKEEASRTIPPGSVYNTDPSLLKRVVTLPQFSTIAPIQIPVPPPEAPATPAPDNHVPWPIPPEMTVQPNTPEGVDQELYNEVKSFHNDFLKYAGRADGSSGQSGSGPTGSSGPLGPLPKPDSDAGGEMVPVGGPLTNPPAGGKLFASPNVSEIKKGIQVWVWDTVSAIKQTNGELQKLEDAFLKNKPKLQALVNVLKMIAPGTALAGGMAQVGALDQAIFASQDVAIAFFDGIREALANVATQNMQQDANLIFEGLRQYVETSLPTDTTGMFSGIINSFNAAEIEVIESVINLLENLTTGTAENLGHLVDVATELSVKVAGQLTGDVVAGGAILGAGIAGGKAIEGAVNYVEVNPLLNTADPSQQQQLPEISTRRDDLQQRLFANTTAEGLQRLGQSLGLGTITGKKLERINKILAGASIDEIEEMIAMLGNSIRPQNKQVPGFDDQRKPFDAKYGLLFESYAKGGLTNVQKSIEQVGATSDKIDKVIALEDAVDQLQRNLGAVNKIWKDFIPGKEFGQKLGGFKSQMLEQRNLLFKEAVNIANSIEDGMESIDFDPAKQYTVEEIDDLINAIKARLGIASPSKVFIKIGQDLVAGFEIGVNEGIRNIRIASLEKFVKIADYSEYQDIENFIDLFEQLASARRAMGENVSGADLIEQVRAGFLGAQVQGQMAIGQGLTMPGQSWDQVLAEQMQSNVPVKLPKGGLNPQAFGIEDSVELVMEARRRQGLPLADSFNPYTENGTLIFAGPQSNGRNTSPTGKLGNLRQMLEGIMQTIPSSPGEFIQQLETGITSAIQNFVGRIKFRQSVEDSAQQQLLQIAQELEQSIQNASVGDDDPTVPVPAEIMYAMGYAPGRVQPPPSGMREGPSQSSDPAQGLIPPFQEQKGGLLNRLREWFGGLLNSVTPVYKQALNRLVNFSGYGELDSEIDLSTPLNNEQQSTVTSVIEGSASSSSSQIQLPPLPPLNPPTVGLSGVDSELSSVATSLDDSLGALSNSVGDTTNSLVTLEAEIVQASTAFDRATTAVSVGSDNFPTIPVIDVSGITAPDSSISTGGTTISGFSSPRTLSSPWSSNLSGITASPSSGIWSGIPGNPWSSLTALSVQRASGGGINLPPIPPSPWMPSTGMPSGASMGSASVPSPPPLPTLPPSPGSTGSVIPVTPPLSGSNRRPFMMNVDEAINRQSQAIVNGINNIDDANARAFDANVAEGFGQAMDEVEWTAQSIFDIFGGIFRTVGAIEQKFPQVGRAIRTVKDMAGGLLVGFGIYQLEDVIAGFARTSVTSALQIERFKASLQFTPGINGRQVLEEIYQYSNKIGIGFTGAAESISRLMVAASGTSISAQVKDIAKSFQAGLAAQGASNVQQERTFLALQQMIGKGVIQAEELRAQLAESMPQALGAMARALGYTEEQLTAVLSKTKLLPEEVLLRLGYQLEAEATAPGAMIGQGILGDINRTQNIMEKYQMAFGDKVLNIADGSALGGVINPIKTLNAVLEAFLGIADTVSIMLGVTLVSVTAKFIGSMFAAGNATRTFMILFRLLGVNTNTFAQYDRFATTLNNIGLRGLAASSSLRGVGVAAIGASAGVASLARALAPLALISLGIQVLTTAFTTQNQELEQLVKNAQNASKALDDMGKQRMAKEDMPYGDNAPGAARRGLSRWFGLSPVPLPNLGGLSLDRPMLGLFDRVQTVDGKEVLTSLEDRKQAKEVTERAPQFTRELENVLSTAEGQYLNPRKLDEASKKITEFATNRERLITEIGINQRNPNLSGERLQQLRAQLNENEAAEQKFRRENLIPAETIRQQLEVAKSIKEIILNAPGLSREQKQDLVTPLDKLISQGQALLEVVNQNTNLNRNQVALLNSLNLISAEYNNRLFIAQRESDIRGNRALSDRAMPGGIDDITLQARQLQNNLVLAQDKFNASTEAAQSSLQKALQQYGPGSQLGFVDEEIKRQFQTQMPGSRTFATGYETIINASDEQIEKLLEEGSGLTGNQRAYVDALKQHRQQLAQALTSQRELNQAQIDIDRFQKERLYMMRETAIIIGTNNAQMTRNTRLLNGQITTLETPILEANDAVIIAGRKLADSIAKIGDQITDPEQVKRDVSGAQVELSNAQLGQRRANIDFAGGLFDLNQQIFDYRFNVEQTNIDIERQNRDLIESYEDLMFDLQDQIDRAALSLKETQVKIAQSTRALNLEKAGFSDSLFKDIGRSISELIAIYEDSGLESDRLDQEAKEIGRQYVETLRRIRGEQEKQLDAERQRTKQMVDMINAQAKMLLALANVTMGFQDQIQSMIAQQYQLFRSWVNQVPPMPTGVSQPGISGPIVPGQAGTGGGMGAGGGGGGGTSEPVSLNFGLLPSEMSGVQTAGPIEAIGNFFKGLFGGGNTQGNYASSMSQGLTQFLKNQLIDESRYSRQEVENYRKAIFTRVNKFGFEDRINKTTLELPFKESDVASQADKLAIRFWNQWKKSDPAAARAFTLSTSQDIRERQVMQERSAQPQQNRALTKEERAARARQTGTKPLPQIPPISNPNSPDFQDRVRNNNQPLERKREVRNPQGQRSRVSQPTPVRQQQQQKPKASPKPKPSPKQKPKPRVQPAQLPTVTLPRGLGQYQVPPPPEGMFNSFGTIALPPGLAAPRFDFGESRVLADRGYALDMEVVQKKRELTEVEKLQKLYAKQNEIIGRIIQTEEAILASRRNMRDTQVGVMDFAETAKGFSTVDEEFARLLRDLRQKFVSEVESRMDQVRTIEDTLRANQQIVNVSRKELETNTSLSPEQRRVVEDQLNSAQKLLQIKAQEKLVLEGQVTQLNEQYRISLDILSAREQTARAIQSQQIFANKAAQLAETQYNVSGNLGSSVGTVINAAPVIRARMGAIAEMDELKRQLDAATNISPERKKQLLDFQKQINDLNINRSMVEAIPGLEAFSSGLKDAILFTDSLDNAFKKLKDTILGMLLDQLTIKPIQNWIAQTVAPFLGLGDGGPTEPIQTRRLSGGDANTIVPFFREPIDPSRYEFVGVAEQTSDALAGLSTKLDTASSSLIDFGGTLDLSGADILGFAGNLTNLFLGNGQQQQGAVSGLLGGVLGMLFGAEGGPVDELPEIPVMALGGMIGKAMQTERMMSGREPVLAVLNKDEYVVKASEVPDYLAFKNWSQIRSADVRSFADGGFVGRPMVVPSSGQPQKMVVHNYQQSNTFIVKTAQDLGRSVTQAQRRQKLEAERAGIIN